MTKRRALVLAVVACLLGQYAWYRSAIIDPFERSFAFWAFSAAWVLFTVAGLVFGAYYRRRRNDSARATVR